MAGGLNFMQRLPEVKLRHAFLPMQKGPDGPLCVLAKNLTSDGMAW